MLRFLLCKVKGLGHSTGLVSLTEKSRLEVEIVYIEENVSMPG